MSVTRSDMDSKPGLQQQKGDGGGRRHRDEALDHLLELSPAVKSCGGQCVRVGGGGGLMAWGQGGWLGRHQL